LQADLVVLVVADGDRDLARGRADRDAVDQDLGALDVGADGRAAERQAGGAGVGLGLGRRPRVGLRLGRRRVVGDDEHDDREQQADGADADEDQRGAVGGDLRVRLAGVDGGVRAAHRRDRGERAGVDGAGGEGAAELGDGATFFSGAHGAEGLAEQFGEPTGGLDALLAVLAEGQLQQLDGRGRGVARGRDLGPHVLEHRGHRALGRERRLALEHLVEDAAERVDVGAVVEVGAVALLGAHVLRGAEHLAGPGQLHGVEAAGDAEVEDFNDGGDADGLDEDVVGLEVAVEDAVLVRLAEALGDLPRELQALELGDAALLEPLGQALAGQQLHDHVRAAVVGLAVLVHADRRRVAQLRGDLELAAEPDDELGVGQALAPDQLDRDLAIDLGVVGLVDDAHAALADDLLDQVAAGDRPADVVGETDLQRRRGGAARLRIDGLDSRGLASPWRYVHRGFAGKASVTV
jgi:hypothetical protein